jgi:hypothetical protein
VLGVVSYYVVDGLGVGIHYEWWLAGSHTHRSQTFTGAAGVPYLGGFYQRTDVDLRISIRSASRRRLYRRETQRLGLGGV